MLPGRSGEYKAKDFRQGLVCGIVGCVRKARHQWAYPCAINTMTDAPAKPAWFPTCDECDVQLNEALLEVVGVPAHVRLDIIEAYKLIQADAAYEKEVT